MKRCIIPDICFFCLLVCFVLFFQIFFLIHASLKAPPAVCLGEHTRVLNHRPLTRTRVDWIFGLVIPLSASYGCERHHFVLLHALQACLLVILISEPHSHTQPHSGFIQGLKKESKNISLFLSMDPERFLLGCFWCHMLPE